jgi:hypothetical protein
VTAQKVDAARVRRALARLDRVTAEHPELTEAEARHRLESPIAAEEEREEEDDTGQQAGEQTKKTKRPRATLRDGARDLTSNHACTRSHGYRPIYQGPTPHVIHPCGHDPRTLDGAAPLDGARPLSVPRARRREARPRLR